MLKNFRIIKIKPYITLYSDKNLYGKEQKNSYGKIVLKQINNNLEFKSGNISENSVDGKVLVEV